MIDLVPMSEDAFEAYLAQSLPNYASDKVIAREWPEEQSLELSRKELQNLLPDGLETPNNYLFSIHDENGTDVGMVWFSRFERAGVPLAYLCDIHIDIEHRRKGYATLAVTAVEEKVRELGLSGMVLHVFAHNTAAKTLYSKLGYQDTNVMMFKRMDGGQF